MDALTRANLEFARSHPGDSGERQPVHVLYGGAHLFRWDTCRRLGKLAEQALGQYAPDAATLARIMSIPDPWAGTVYDRVVEKLSREPVENYGIDFEDGYGHRPNAEEDAAAEAAAREVAKERDQGSLPAFIGIRIKPLNEESKARSLRTLEIFMKTLGPLPPNFAVALPKITVPEQVAALAAILADYGVHRMDLMIETPASLFLLPRLVEAAGNLKLTMHFGPYDYTAGLGITAANQNILHPACVFARSWMQAQLAGGGVSLSDGPTTLLPIPPHRGDGLSASQQEENRAALHRAWKLHFDHIRQSLNNGFYQSWDLHPAQLVSRYAAVYSFFLEGLEAAAERLLNFVQAAAQATHVAGVFDDAATGQGLLNYFVRAIDCGAIAEPEARTLTGLSPEELRSASFARIVAARASVTD